MVKFTLTLKQESSHWPRGISSLGQIQASRPSPLLPKRYMWELSGGPFGMPPSRRGVSRRAWRRSLVPWLRRKSLNSLPYLAHRLDAQTQNGCGPAFVCWSHWAVSSCSLLEARVPFLAGSLGTQKVSPWKAIGLNMGVLCAVCDNCRRVTRTPEFNFYGIPSLSAAQPGQQPTNCLDSKDLQACGLSERIRMRHVRGSDSLCGSLCKHRVNSASLKTSVLWPCSRLGSLLSFREGQGLYVSIGYVISPFGAAWTSKSARVDNSLPWGIRAENCGDKGPKPSHCMNTRLSIE